MNQRFRAAGAKKIDIKGHFAPQARIFLTLKAFFRKISTGKLVEISIFKSVLHS